jgi:phosphoribosylformimino-5-aminoimidazole carboxamide ribotide isomerase
MAFTIYPAIDLRGGKVVRLAQGDLARTTVYADDPVLIARRWQTAGAEWIHVVNLDAAFGESALANWLALEYLVGLGVKVQFGGGLRSIDSIRQVIKLGVERVVVGTAAVENPALVEQALAEFGPDRIVVGIDARDGKVRIKGWAEESATTAIELGQRLKRAGLKTVVFTDVARDGIGVGVNVDGTVELAEKSGLEVIASGGVKDIEDVKRVRGAGLSGLIMGRALYEGRVRLTEALQFTQST